MLCSNGCNFLQRADDYAEAATLLWQGQMKGVLCGAGTREEGHVKRLTGRRAALEVIAMTALGLHLAHARNDPDYQTSGALLASMLALYKPKRQLCQPKLRSM